jgi:hypothetical protein
VANRSIEFDVEALLGRLNILQATQIKYAGGKAMRRLGYELKQTLRDEMSRTFDRPVPFTLTSPKYDPNGLSLRVFLLTDSPRGQSPSRYLYPVSTEDTVGAKPAYTTRFTRALRHLGIIDSDHYAIPWLNGRAVPTNEYGNVPGSFYSGVLRGLARQGAKGASPFSKYGGQYMSVPDRRSAPSIRRTSSLKPGIYRVKGRQLDFLFRYVLSPPSVTTIFDYRGIVDRRAQAILPTLLSQELDKAMR